MQIHDLKSKSERKYSKPRVGRGGKRGTSSGHGTKGQKSRSGHRIRPAVRDLIQRLPKLRGYANNPKSDKPRVFNVSDLEKSGLTEISISALTEAKLIKKSDKRVKILGNGEVSRKLTIDGLEVSRSAREKIEKAGGKIIAKVNGEVAENNAKK
ncbi:MAG: 50S ribosomal protein L15 [Candidatus Harrisonbacteria bacterium CG10_big_fil_rev_8_21_14_0_10_45_28]|uniref:Large ribosomal subunit protein uL15 n=1 Tax=Candidatus Harrisonbacteria bacterium CG10_big_fil_rev_8_21_14_0_10_45_28 TaxID=1974586 RepID=A0A2H0UP00_9BACT|nr:MAG: 50S ribosomal protein L15 [Candidatus Harrisonbacteria bacterium CG10_big_fil_rev_8_21_14_0_10_45_28]